MDDSGQLETIVERGGPAHAREAQRLLDLARGGADVAEETALLWDAYLNDPYLDRG